MKRGNRPSRFGVWAFITAAVIALVLAGTFVVLCTGVRREYEQEAVTPLAVVECDLSEPMEIRIPLTVRYDGGHGLKVLVDGPPYVERGHEPASWLGGLAGIAAYERAPFQYTEAVRLMRWLSFASGPDPRAIVRMPGSPPGEYVILLTVTSGAPGLSDQTHRVIVMNDVCGCETLVCVIFWIIAGLLTGVAAVLLAIAWMLAQRQRSRAASVPLVT